MNGRLFEEYQVLGAMSNIQAADVVVYVCYCKNGIPDCTKQIPFIDIKTGEKLILNVVIADRGNHIVNGSIKSEVRGHVLIRDDQKIQDVTNGCTPASQQLIMSPQLEIDNVHMTTESSERSIKLNFLSCIDCPIGFQKTEDDAKGCDCVCNAMLEPYVVNCNYKRETITKKDTKAWIAYLNIKNASDYFVYPYCPMDYCLPRDKTVEIN